MTGSRAECSACGHTFYANPSPSVCALVVRDGRLLLARRAGDPGKGKWDMPGGFVEEGEDPLDALRRELQEETGLDVEVGEFFGVYADWYFERGTLNLYWLAAADGEPNATDDISEVAWFSPDELPARDEIAFENVARVLARWRDEQA